MIDKCRVVVVVAVGSGGALKNIGKLAWMLANGDGRAEERPGRWLVLFGRADSTRLIAQWRGRRDPSLPPYPRACGRKYVNTYPSATARISSKFRRPSVAAVAAAVVVVVVVNVVVYLCVCVCVCVCIPKRQALCIAFPRPGRPTNPQQQAQKALPTPPIPPLPTSVTARHVTFIFS